MSGVKSFAALCPSLGHNLAEMVSVQAYLRSETTPLTWVGGASLEYVQDDAQVGETHKCDPIHYKVVHPCDKMHQFVNRFLMLCKRCQS